MERGAEEWKPLVELFGNVPDETSPLRRLISQYKTR